MLSKAIGSVADAAGKVLKSDVGKMALLYAAGTYYMGGAAGGFGGFNQCLVTSRILAKGARFL